MNFKISAGRYYRNKFIPDVFAKVICRDEDTILYKPNHAFAVGECAFKSPAYKPTYNVGICGKCFGSATCCNKKMFRAFYTPVSKLEGMFAVGE